VGWDEESDDETPSKAASKAKASPIRPASIESSTTVLPTPSITVDQTNVKTSEDRKSHDEKSQPDSEASYDLVGAASGAPSHAPGSPREVRKGEDSEEEDWE